MEDIPPQTLSDPRVDPAEAQLIPLTEPDLAQDIDLIQGLDSTSRILQAASAISGLRFVAIARVTEGRWVTCASLDRLGFGLKPGDELKVATTLCHDVRCTGDLIVIEDVESDPVYRDHPTPRQYGFRSYISVPIVDRRGSFFGTLCGIDPDPATLDGTTIVETFLLFADLIAAQLDAHREVAEQKSILRSERSFGKLREEFMAVLGHDLRNPVTAILAGTRILERCNPEAETLEVLRQIRSSAERMDGLLGDLLDLARGRLGGGIPIERDPNADLQAEFRHVVTEVAAISECDIRACFDFGPVNCDRVRMGQVLSNLLGNAVLHGTPGEPVEVRARSSNGEFRLSVTNAGPPIDSRAARWIFLPFRRGQADANRQGLGLGLYIASQVARAHGGTLTFTSGEGKVTFTLTMPC